MKVKYCKKCEVELIRFYNKVKNRLICHDCYKEWHREIRSNNKDEINKRKRNRYKLNKKEKNANNN